MRTILALLLTLLAAPALAEPGRLCRGAIQAAEREARLPPQLLMAIARVESGRRDPTTGSFHPWPWTINAEGRGYFFASKPEAIAAVQALWAQGVRSIDVGCMQINLMHHPDAFASLEDALDPLKNATYAGNFLRELYGARKSWPEAVARYHSATPQLHERYRNRVYALWSDLQAPPPRVQTAAAVAAPTVPPIPVSSRAFLPTGAVNNWIVMRGRMLQVSAIGRR
jgi:soluble lytic murein transglycosylase-like protein